MKWKVRVKVSRLPHASDMLDETAKRWNNSKTAKLLSLPLTSSPTFSLTPPPSAHHHHAFSPFTETTASESFEKQVKRLQAATHFLSAGAALNFRILRFSAAHLHNTRQDIIRTLTPSRQRTNKPQPACILKNKDFIIFLIQLLFFI